MFRYANRHDFIVRPSDCMPRVIYPSVAPSASYFFFCYLYTKPSRVVAVPRQRRRRRWRGSRKSQINPFVIPHRSFQPVRISTTSLLCHLRAPSLSPPENSFPLSLPSLPIVPVKRDSTILPSLSISSPLPSSNITLFSPFFSLLSFPLDPPRCTFASSLARSASSSSFFFRLFPVHIFRSRNFASSSSHFNSERVNACPDRICFVCFSCAILNRDFLAIHACHHYDIWRRKLQPKWGPPGFATTFVTVGSANRNWSSCCGERDKEIY